MIRQQKILKPVAMSLLVLFIQSLFLPAVAHALTSGPTAPEATSFEPVDTTDMVNLQTGDLTYSMPLLEVPGPEGGYPLSLAYHAGIKPLEDASWVGLGWNLSPGAINRVVSGYPDDHKEITRTVEDYWEGGETHSFTVSVGIGSGEGLGGNLGFSISHDTYKGFGGSVSLGLGYKAGKANIGTGVTMGSSGVSFDGVNAGLSGDINAQGFSKSISMNVGPGGGSLSGGISKSYKDSNGKVTSTHGVGSMGVSMSSNGLKPSYSVAGVSASSVNNNYGKISTSSVGISVPLIVVPVSVGYRYTRYWMHERDYTETYGILYAAAADDNWTSEPMRPYYSATHSYDKSLDSYALLSPEANLSDSKLDATKELGGALPSYDRYSISAQGVSGQISPLVLENGSLFNKQKITNDGGNTDYDVSYYSAKSFSKKVNFRFVNDFSNRYSVTSLPTMNGVATAGSTSNYLNFNQSGYGAATSVDGYNSTDQHLAGSKHIEWFSNKNIDDDDAYTDGFIDYSGSTIQRLGNLHGFNISDNIGGFSVTNESGVTYHYALPVYSYAEYHYSAHDDQSNGASWNKQFNPAPYAYTWLLTSITGPDFVDTNQDGKADEDDWGYWVNFNYGKWTDKYEWRTPYTGYYKDIDNNISTFSYGKKEIYYLDAVQTRTHTALFVKDIRYDAKSITGKSGGVDVDDTKVGTCPVETQQPGNYVDGPIYAKTEKPISQLKLNRILLLKNDRLEGLIGSNDLNTIKDNFAAPYDEIAFTLNDINDQICDQSPSYNTTFPIIRTYHNSDNVITTDDLIGLNLESNVLKSIWLNTDYSLSPETANSFDHSSLYTPGGTVPNNKLGKLTLNSVEIKSRNGQSIMPAINFGYGSYNPSFDAGKYDYWGYYKSDYNGSADASPSDFCRHPSSTSKDNIDAWSLKSIETATGAEINIEYEAKEFTDVVLQKKNRMNISSLVRMGGSNDYTLQFHENEILSNIFSIGEQIEVSILKHNLLEILPINQPIMETKMGTIISVSTQEIIVNIPFSLLPSFSYLVYSNAGFVDFIGTHIKYGNGIRVSSIEVSDGSQSNSNKTIYEYSNGTVSFLPVGLDIIANLTNTYKEETYKFAYYKNFIDLIKLSNIVPAPSVMYKNITVRNQANGVDVPGEARYEFQVFESNMIDNTSETTPVAVNNINAGGGSSHDIEVKRRNHVIKDKTVQIGNLVRMEQVNGQGQIIHSVTNNYADESDYATHNYQGVEEQAFTQSKTIDNASEIQMINTVYKRHPSFLKSVTTSTNGTVTTSYNKKFDFYTGEPIEVESQNSYGDKFLAKSVPAYTKYDGMGLKVNNINNKNMLTQSTASYLYKTDATGIPTHVVSAAVTTWNDDWYYREKSGDWYSLPSTTASEKVWRKHRSYGYKPENADINGLIAINNFNDFDWTPVSNPDYDWTTLNQHSDWQKVSEVTLYDRYSKPLEEWNITGNYSAAKMGYDQTKVIGVAANAKYVEFASCGGEVEDYNATTRFFGGEVKLASGANLINPSTDKVNNKPIAHTGTSSIKASGQGYVYRQNIGSGTGEISAGKYRASIWVYNNGNTNAMVRSQIKLKSTNAVVSNGQKQSKVNTSNTIKVGNWYLVNLDFEIPTTNANGTCYLEVSTNGGGSLAYFDDFRFHPLDAPMTTYVYDEFDQLTYILDTENFFTEYQYDERGRLKATYRESSEVSSGKRLVSKNDYMYSRW